MEKFTKIKSIPAYIPLMNIDTDKIIPKQFLKTIKRTGLGEGLFFEMRYDQNGNLVEDFILNKIKFKIPRKQFNKFIKCNLLIKQTLFLKLEKVEME